MSGGAAEEREREGDSVCEDACVCAGERGSMLFRE